MWYSKWYFKDCSNNLWNTKNCAQVIRLTDASIKNAKALAKDYVMGDGYGLQLKVRTNGSKLWNFNSYHPVTKKRLNIGLDAYL